MAKRKRLVVPSSPEDAASPLETKSGFPLGVARHSPARPPIAQVAGDAAAQSALDDLAQEMERARAEGRLLQALPLEAVVADHQIRDRLVSDQEDMQALCASIRARGQQTPIEVVALEDGRYGLISGWRRLQALHQLYAETGAADFATITAMVKPVDTVSDSYVAMVEENEIRVGLSYYERAHLVVAAVKLGIYPDVAAAVQTLFANGSAARRSKILSFTRLHDALGAGLRFPAAIPERLGLGLAAALERDAGLGRKLRDMLRKTPAADAAAERAALERALKKATQDPGLGPAPDQAAPKSRQVAPGLKVQVAARRVVLSGPALTPQLVQALEDWLAAQGGEAPAGDA